MARRTIRITTTIKRRITVTRRVTLRPIYSPPPPPIRLQPVARPRITAPTRSVTASPLAEIRQAVAAYTDEEEDDSSDDKQYDVFISHASEDQEAVVRPLAQALVEAGVRVWYSEFVLRIGDSLRRRIDAGLAISRFGVVVLSPSFFAKRWPNYELDGLVTRELAGDRQLILPVWHNVSKPDVVGYSPSLADKLARSTDDTELAEIAREIAEVIRG